MYIVRFECMNQCEADNLVLALSKCCKVEQWFCATTSDGKPYVVSCEVPSRDVCQINDKEE